MFESRWGLDISKSDNWTSYRDIEKQVCNLDGGFLPYLAKSFDAITTLMVLEHVFNPFHAARELRRVCKPDGCVVIGVPNAASIKHRISLAFGRLPITSARFSFDEEAWDGYHLHNFTRSSLAWLLTRVGLKPVWWASSGKFQLLKRRRLELFGGDLIVLCVPAEPQPDLRFAA